MINVLELQKEIEFLKVKLLQALDVIESYRYLEYYDFPSQQLKVEPEDLNEELREMFPDFPEYKH